MVRRVPVNTSVAVKPHLCWQVPLFPLKHEWGSEAERDKEVKRDMKVERSTEAKIDRETERGGA